MKKILFLLIIFSFSVITVANAQCKFKKIKKLTKFVKSEDCSVRPVISTKAKLLFDQFAQLCWISYVKSGDDYYMFILLRRGYSSKIEIHENNPIVLNFDDDELLSLYPCGLFKSKTALTVTLTACYYKITKEQLERIAERNSLESFLVHFSCDEEIAGAQIAEDGSQFLEYSIHAENYGNNATDAAACILTK